MIIEKEGNLLNAEDCEAIIHQTNCLGIMGGGIAKQIKEKWPIEVYEMYHSLCHAHKNSKDLLGKIQILSVSNSKIKFVINMFSQFGIGWNHSTNGRNTDYDAFRTCLKEIKTICKEKGIKSIGMPKNIGCGLAGGNWEGNIYPMLKEEFDNYNDITLYIYEYAA